VPVKPEEMAEAGGWTGIRPPAGSPVSPHRRAPRRHRNGRGWNDAQARGQFEVNVLAPILTSKEAVKHFGPAGGSIVNISSIASTLTPRMPPSTAPPRRRDPRALGR